MPSAADHYAALLPPRARERPLLEAPAAWSELELQACWFAGDFGRDFVSTEGQPVRVVQFGVWNHEAGPDFSQAAVSIAGGEPVTGPIEFDTAARDWENHGHAQNADYEGTILHVYTHAGNAEFFTRTARHRRVPQVLLDQGALRGAPPQAMAEAKLGACAAPLEGLQEEQTRAVLLGAAEYRLRRKAAALARLAETHGADEALFQSLAAVLGYKSNKLPFTLLAQRLSLKGLLQHKEEVDALLFGLSGFLPDRDVSASPPETRQYLRGLWESWWKHRAAWERLVLAPELWRLSGQRPANHPQRRLAAFAQLVRHWREVRKVIDAGDWKSFLELGAGFADPYWSHHYTLTSRPSPQPMALLGESRLTEMMLNVVLPLASLRDARALENFRKWRAPLTNRRVEVAAIRLFGNSPQRRALLKNAALQQGLLQIYEDFCLQDASDCARCPFPRQVAQW